MVFQNPFTRRVAASLVVFLGVNLLAAVLFGEIGNGMPIHKIRPSTVKDVQSITIDSIGGSHIDEIDVPDSTAGTNESVAVDRGRSAGSVVPALWRRSRAFSCIKKISNGWDPEAKILARVSVVYGATLAGHPGEIAMIHNQLKSLFLVGLMGSGIQIHIVFSFGLARVVAESEATAKDVKDHILTSPDFLGLVLAIYSWARHANIHIRYENMFEWPALHFLWTEANGNPDNIFLYFHSKGLAHPKYNGTRRTTLEMALFREVVAPWKAVIGIFQTFGHSVKHLGFLTSHFGYQWFNFFWARGKHLAGLPEPKLVERRWYYAEWLGRAKSPGPSCPEGEDLAALKGTCKQGCIDTFSLVRCARDACGWATEALTHSKNDEKRIKEDIADFV